MKRNTPESIWKRIDKSGGVDACWNWTGTVNGSRKVRGGYGTIAIGGKTLRVHRVAWELTFGAIPDGLLVCHRCDNRRCCNPGHLFLGTVKDNADDMTSKNRGSKSFGDSNGVRLHPERIAKGERQGSAKLTTEQVKYILSSNERNCDLARRFGVGAPAIGKIRRREAWTHVQ